MITLYPWNVRKSQHALGCQRPAVTIMSKARSGGKDWVVVTDSQEILLCSYVTLIPSHLFSATVNFPFISKLLNSLPSFAFLPSSDLNSFKKEFSLKTFFHDLGSSFFIFL